MWIRRSGKIWNFIWNWTWIGIKPKFWNFYQILKEFCSNLDCPLKNYSKYLIDTTCGHSQTKITELSKQQPSYQHIQSNRNFQINNNALTTGEIPQLCVATIPQVTQKTSIVATRLNKFEILEYQVEFFVSWKFWTIFKMLKSLLSTDRDVKEAALIEKRRLAEKERQKRFFDAKQRILGVSLWGSPNNPSLTQIFPLF